MGESEVHTAKRTEAYATTDHSPPKAKVLFICGVSRLSYPKFEKPGYIVSLLESDPETMVFSVASDRYCLTEEEESGFNEIRKRLLEPGNQKSLFVLTETLFHIDEQRVEVCCPPQSECHTNLRFDQHGVHFRVLQRYRYHGAGI